MYVDLRNQNYSYILCMCPVNLPYTHIHTHWIIFCVFQFDHVHCPLQNIPLSVHIIWQQIQTIMQQQNWKAAKMIILFLKTRIKHLHKLISNQFVDLHRHNTCPLSEIIMTYQILYCVFSASSTPHSVTFPFFHNKVTRSNIYPSPLSHTSLSSFLSFIAYLYYNQSWRMY